MLITAGDDALIRASILDAGNDQVVLCERGLRSFDPAVRNVLDISAVPALRERTHLPIIVDPSHAAGKRSLVEPLAHAAAAVGADGLLIEIHSRPIDARSDGDQALEPARLAPLVERCRQISTIVREAKES